MSAYGNSRGFLSRFRLMPRRDFVFRFVVSVFGMKISSVDFRVGGARRENLDMLLVNIDIQQNARPIGNGLYGPFESRL